MRSTFLEEPQCPSCASEQSLVFCKAIPPSKASCVEAFVHAEQSSAHSGSLIHLCYSIYNIFLQSFDVSPL